MKRTLIALALLASAAPAGAQQSPDTDVFVAELRRVDDRYVVAEPRNVTARPGYDNQPWFLPGGDALLYVSEREAQQDIFRHDLATGAAVQLTRTPTREFSPTLLPSGEMMVVRWEADMSDGQLWLFTPEGEPLRRATGTYPRVGYYAFADDRTLAMFINDSTQSFVIADAVTGETEKIGERMGGSPPKAIPGERAVSFLRQAEDGAWWITRLDVATREAAPLVKALPGRTQYAWTPAGTILMASGNTIYEWDPKRGGEWAAVVAFDQPALQDVSRIAVSPAGDRIAFVATVTP